MTDNEIKKALECCGTYKGKCTDCPAFVKVDRSNCKKVLLGAIDLINRLQAENERLTHITRNLIGEIKAEAYMEFAEVVKEEITNAIISNGMVIRERVEKHNANRYEDGICLMCDGKVNALVGIDDFIDNLLKEMVGEDNA